MTEAAETGHVTGQEAAETGHVTEAAETGHLTEVAETGHVTGQEAAEGETGHVTEVVIVLGREKGTERGPKGIEEGTRHVTEAAETGHVTEAAETGHVTEAVATGSRVIEAGQFALISRADDASETVAGHEHVLTSLFSFVRFCGVLRCSSCAVRLMLLLRSFVLKHVFSRQIHPR